MHDLLPQQAALWRHVRDTAERVAGLFGYGLVGTPIVEDASVFLRTVGDESDIVSKEMYVFEDRGGDRLALRPEGTAAVCRAYIEHGMSSLPQPVRLYYFGPMFRYDRPQAGRYRQLWQFGVECIGDASPAADVEVIDLQRTLYEQLGLGELTLRVNSIGTAVTRHRYIEALTEHLSPHVATLSRDSQRRFETNVLRVLDSKEDAGHPAVEGAPNILDYLDEGDRRHFDEIKALLEGLGIRYEVDSRIVRGLDYYARTVWEFEPAGAGGQSTVGAGGRYDGLIELLGGPPTPGTGMATGIERIMLNLSATPDLATARRPSVYIAPLGENLQAALAAAREVRLGGATVRMGQSGRSLRAHFRAAESFGSSHIGIVGNNEAARGVIQLKPLIADGDQIELRPSDVPEFLGTP